MNVWAWIVVGSYAIDLVALPVFVGKPQKPMTGRVAACRAALALSYIVLVYLAATR